MELTQHRKMCGVVLAGVLVVSMCAGTQPQASAAEKDRGIEAATSEDVTVCSTDDYVYDFDTMTYKGATNGTGWHKKEDDSPVYVNIDYIDNKCRMYVDGKKGTKTHDCTVNGYAVARKVGNWCIRTTVNEDGYKKARLTALAYWTAAHVSGVWSADSEYTYTSINA